MLMTEADTTPAQDRPAPGEGASDRTLLERIRLGSQDAAAQLYLRYASRLRDLARAQCSADLARRVEVDDIVQSVFGSFFRRASKGYYDIPAGEELWKLFLVIALNKIRAKALYHRAAKRDVRRTVGGGWFEHTLESVASDDESARAVLRLTMEDVLQRLPERHRGVLELRAEGYEVAEIARETGRAKRSVERILQEFRERLSAAIRADE
jgi:RNA polymerase sigma-70 factor (ECF subfamily)